SRVHGSSAADGGAAPAAAREPGLAGSGVGRVGSGLARAPISQSERERAPRSRSLSERQRAPRCPDPSERKRGRPSPTPKRALASAPRPPAVPQTSLVSLPSKYRNK